MQNIIKHLWAACTLFSLGSKLQELGLSFLGMEVEHT